MVAVRLHSRTSPILMTHDKKGYEFSPHERSLEYRNGGSSDSIFYTGVTLFVLILFI